MKMKVAMQVDRGKIEIQEQEITYGPNQVLVQNLMVAPSIGTDLNVYRELQTNLPGWKPNYPCGIGGSGVGRVVEIGKEVKEVKIGEEILAWNVQEYSAIDADKLIRIQGAPHEEASFLHQARVGLNAIRRARMVLGDNALVIGLGAIGILTLQLARLAGAGRLFATDLVQKRLDIAKQLGADQTINAREEDFGEKALALTDQKGMNVIFELSGTWKTLQPAMKAAAFMGKIIVSSWICSPAENLRLGDDFHFKQLELISSQIFYLVPGDVNHIKFWTDEASYNYLYDLMREGKLRMKETVSHYFKLEETDKAFELAAKPTEDFTGLLIRID